MDVFGRYRLVKRLGAGGMGEVYLARTGAASDLVVVKRILPHLVENPRFLRLFLDETRIASRLVHPNIARIFELGEAEGTWYVAMEHVPGKDLREVMKRAREQETPVPTNVALKVAAEVAKALEYAHAVQDAQGRSLRIVHRDVSPHNILLSEKGAVKLIDFGVAKAANKSVHTASGILKGKFPYMAPEQASAAPVDARTDVFALGIVLWELLCGRGLFRGKSDVATIKLVRACVVAPPSEHREGLPEGFDRLVLKALRREPKDRYQTAAAFQEAIEGVLAELPPPNLARWLRLYADVPGLDDSDEELPVIDGASVDGRQGGTVVGIPADPAVLEVGAGGGVAHPAAAPDDREGEAPRLLAQLEGQPTNLGPQATSFVGRVAELADLHQLFRQGARLITLLGPGGSGKSRLATQFAAQLVSHFRSVGEDGRSRGGVWYCDLGEVSDLEGACAAVSRALAVPLAPGDVVLQLGHALLARGEVLVVLDNFEQVLAHGAATLARWMQVAPAARFIVSSRELLRVPQETVFEVPPLRVPGVGDDARSSEAVRLFIERVRATKPGWEPGPADDEPLAEIVRQLDGLPLAIELAAARASVLSPTQLLRALSRRFELLVGGPGPDERRPILREAIDWSWESLSSIEQSGLAQLSVFRGGFTAAAVDVVLRVSAPGGAVGSPTALAVLTNLRAKSLVRAYFPRGDEGQTRFGLYETIREYARERLRQLPDEAGALARHAAYCLELGETLAQGAEGSAASLDSLDLERDNLTSIFRRALAAPARHRDAVRAVLALDPLLTLRGPFGLHLPMLDAALKTVGAQDELRALVLESRGRARQARGRLPEAEQDFHEALRLARALKSPGLEGRLDFYLGNVALRQGHRSHAHRRFTRALKLLRVGGDQRTSGRVLSNLAVLLHELGRENEALEAYGRALETHRAVGDRRYEGVTLANLGVQQQSLGLLRQAKANYRAALAIHRELGNRRSEGITHINLGDLSRDLGQPGQATAHYENALTILREAGARRFEGVALSSWASLHQEEGRLAEAEQSYRRALEVFAAVGEQQYEGLALAGLAAIDAVRGRLPEAEATMGLATERLSAVGDAGFLEALDVYRAHLELAQAAAARSEGDRDAHLARYERLLDHAECAGPPDDAHPSGVPSPADRSEHVRSALRSLQHAHDRLVGNRPLANEP